MKWKIALAIFWDIQNTECSVCILFVSDTSREIIQSSESFKKNKSFGVRGCWSPRWCCLCLLNTIYRIARVFIFPFRSLLDLYGICRSSSNSVFINSTIADNWNVQLDRNKSFVRIWSSKTYPRITDIHRTALYGHVPSCSTSTSSLRKCIPFRWSCHATGYGPPAKIALH